jgi:hypothetical protein
MTHAGLFDLACGKPDFWRGSEEKSPNSEARTSDNILTEDFCVLAGEYFFVRCVLQQPVLGASDVHFGFGVWATLSKKSFNIYLDTFDSGHRHHRRRYCGSVAIATRRAAGQAEGLEKRAAAEYVPQTNAMIACRAPQPYRWRQS